MMWWQLLCAAVSDFRPDHVAEEKINERDIIWFLTLEPTQDIAASIGRMKSVHQRLIAFALRNK